MENLSKQQKFIIYKFLHKKMFNMTIKELEDLEKLLGDDKIGIIINKLLKPLIS